MDLPTAGCGVTKELDSNSLVLLISLFLQFWCMNIYEYFMIVILGVLSYTYFKLQEQKEVVKTKLPA